MKELQRYGNDTGLYCRGLKVLHSYGMAQDHIAMSEGIANVWEWQWSILQGDKVLQRYGMAQEHIARGEGIAKVAMDHIAMGEGIAKVWE